MVDLKQLRSLNDVFTNVMRQIFLTPISSDATQNELTWAHRKILLMIESGGPQKMSAIARQISVTMSGATAVVDKMVQTGLVTRELSPSDRRVVLIAISEKGRALMRDCVARQEKCFESVLDRLPPEKQTELLQSFERIHALLKELQEDAGDIKNPSGEATSTAEVQNG